MDVEQAKSGPFGGTIAHGYLTLSLCAYFLGQLARVSGISMGINYGIDKARFIAPVPAGSRVRGQGEVVSVTEVAGRRAGRRADHGRARGVGEARRGRRHRLALPRLGGGLGLGGDVGEERVHHRGIDDAPHRWERVEQRVAVARGREPAVEDRDDAAVLAAADQPARALRERERGRGQVDVAKARAAASARPLRAGPGRAGRRAG